MPPRPRKPWLPCSPTVSKDGKYHHFHLVEDSAAWDATRNGVIAYFKAAHADAINHLEALAGTSLHPAGVASTSPYADYPHVLPQETLQGYFGEIMAGWFAEKKSPSGIAGWTVPAHLCRFHLTAFQYLEKVAQSGSGPSAIVGRTGDDCLAFMRDASGAITDILFCEAKCTGTHNASLISDAHDKAASGTVADLPRLIEVLMARTDPDSASWVDSIRELHLKLVTRNMKSVKRHDLVCYVHSQSPIRTKTWIPTDAPHAKYTAKRVLNAVELRLANVIERLEAVYAAGVWQ